MASGSPFYEPLQRVPHVTVAFGEQLFLWGGPNEDDKETMEELTSFVEIFDISTEQWERKPCHGSLPPSDGGAYTVIENKLYYFGGGEGGIDTESVHYNSLHQLDLLTLEWREVKPKESSSAPGEKAGCGMVALRDEKLVVVGGSFATLKYTNELHLFDISQERWASQSTAGEGPPPCAFFNFVRVDLTKAVLTGGQMKRGDHQCNVFILEMEEWHWMQLDHIPAAPSHTACCIAGPLISREEHPLLFLMGDSFLSPKLCQDPYAGVLDIDRGTWNPVVLPDAVGPQMGHSLTVTNFGSAAGFRQVVVHGTKGNPYEIFMITTPDVLILLLPGVRPLQQLCLEYVVAHYEEHTPFLYHLPVFLQQEIGRWKNSFIVRI